MLHRKHIYLFLAIVAGVILFSLDADAQCAMCKKVAEGKGNAAIVKNLNNAILYLMAAPYVLLALFFRKQIVTVFKLLKAKLFPAKSL